MGTGRLCEGPGGTAGQEAGLSGGSPAGGRRRWACPLLWTWRPTCAASSGAQASLPSLPPPTPRHVMNELLDTERAYVEELLCVLEVSLQGFVGCLAPQRPPAWGRRLYR